MEGSFMTNTYSIFVKQNKKTRALDDVILVKEGFNFFAMVFNIFWFLCNKLYLFAFLFFIITDFACIVFSPMVAGTFIVLFSILVGFEANNLLLYRFQREKYFFVGYSTGNNRKEASIRFLDEVNKEAKEKNSVIY